MASIPRSDTPSGSSVSRLAVALRNSPRRQPEVNPISVDHTAASQLTSDASGVNTPQNASSNISPPVYPKYGVKADASMNEPEGNKDSLESNNHQRHGTLKKIVTEYGLRILVITERTRKAPLKMSTNSFFKVVAAACFPPSAFAAPTEHRDRSFKDDFHPYALWLARSAAAILGVGIWQGAWYLLIEHGAGVYADVESRNRHRFIWYMIQNGLGGLFFFYGVTNGYQDNNPVAFFTLALNFTVGFLNCVAFTLTHTIPGWRRPATSTRQE